jgi:hypothetical protein
LQNSFFFNMKTLAIFGALILVLGVSTKARCCNYTNGGKCIMHCPGKGRAGYGSLAARPMISPANSLPTSEEKTETKEEDEPDRW